MVLFHLKKWQFTFKSNSKCQKSYIDNWQFTFKSNSKCQKSYIEKPSFTWGSLTASEMVQLHHCDTKWVERPSSDNFIQFTELWRTALKSCGKVRVKLHKKGMLTASLFCVKSLVAWLQDAIWPCYISESVALEPCIYADWNSGVQRYKR